MLYAFISHDVENSAALRASARPAHLARLVELKDQGRLLLAGPFPCVDSPNAAEAGFSGSLIVAEFDDLKQAEMWAAVDPYVDAGVYKETTVRPFKHLLP